MNFYRLIKPLWGKPLLSNGEKNPEFVREIKGDDTIEGCNFTTEFLQQKNQEGYNIYWFPNHPSTDIYATGKKWLSGKLVDTFNYAFVDMDLKDGVYASKEIFLQTLSQFPVKPTMVVDSGNGIHAYWNMEGLTRNNYVLMQMALLTYFKTDDSVYTVLQLMRYPGFKNTKKADQYKDCQILKEHSSGGVYTFKDFPQEIFGLSEEKVLKVTNHLNRLDGKLELQLQHEANIDEIPEEFYDDMLVNDELQKLFNDPKSYNGDRSSADMKLANVLYKRGYKKKQALRVIANTQKALEKGSYRFNYAQLTVDKVYVNRSQPQTGITFQSVAEALRNRKAVQLAAQVFGPYFMDYAVWEKPWRKKQILGLIAGSGVGKTAVALFCIKEMIQNNMNNDDVFVFVTLEMPKEEIYDRWIKLVGAESPLANRLYVVSNEDDQGNHINIGLQEIYQYCDNLKRATGKELGAVIVDHFRILSSHINTQIKPDFGIFAENGTGNGQFRNLSDHKKADAMKILVKKLDTFLIMLTQTTKEKGVGDLPIGKDGAFGTSSFENIVDRLITCWQPLMRVQHMVPMRFLAWQYTKNRHLGKYDKLRLYEPKLLTYNMETGNLSTTTEAEFKVYQQYEPHATAARDAVKNKKGQQVSIQVNIEDCSTMMNKLSVVR